MISNDMSFSRLDQADNKQNDKQNYLKLEE